MHHKLLPSDHCAGDICNEAPDDLWHEPTRSSSNTVICTGKEAAHTASSTLERRNGRAHQLGSGALPSNASAAHPEWPWHPRPTSGKEVAQATPSSSLWAPNFAKSSQTAVVRRSTHPLAGPAPLDNIPGAHSATAEDADSMDLEASTPHPWDLVLGPHWSIVRSIPAER